MDNIKIFKEADDVRIELQSMIDGFGDEITSEDQFPKGTDFHGMVESVKIFKNAVSNNHKIKVICDSDMDGLGCYFLWYKFFTFLPHPNVELIITDRKKGYGFVPEYVQDDVNLYITSDCGITTSKETTDLIKQNNAKTIICDHHIPEDNLPDVDSIIDPYHPEDTTPFKEISGTFVLWFFLKELISEYNLNVNPFREFISELAITTVSDVMPLNQPLNRFIVKTFIDTFDQQDKTYLNTFREQINSNPTSETFAFSLIPMINATQRIAKAEFGAEFLLAETKESSLEWFNYIKSLNDSRKEIQQTLMSYIEKYYKEYINKPFIVIPGKFQKEYKGVLGIISGQLAQQHIKPCIVLNFNENTNEYTGSGRSIGELNILDVLRDNKFVKNVGGHKAALGITISGDKFDDFYSSLQEDIVKIPDSILKPKRHIFGEIPINNIHYDFYKVIHEYEPFGHKFKKPIFQTEGYIKTARLVGKHRNHLAFSITDKNKRIVITGMQFFTKNIPNLGEKYQVIFTFDKDDYKGGESLKLFAQEFVSIP